MNRTTAIAAQFRAALHDGDTDVLAALLHPDVRFQPHDAGTSATCGSADVLDWYRHRRARGFRTRDASLSVPLSLRPSVPRAPVPPV